ncbi:MAG: hypothetical protein ACRELG_06590 [Gemmataceae bacterium]
MTTWRHLRLLILKEHSVMINKQQNLEQMRILTDDIFNGDDRSVAIVGGACIDDLLKQLLQIRLLARFRGLRSREAKRAKETVEKLFDSDRPLGSFSARTDLCLGVGLIGPIAHSDIYYIRQIRNRFAHFVTLPDGSGSLDRVTFKTRQIVDWCSNLQYLRTEPKSRLWTTNAKDQFSGTCVWFSLLLSEQALTMTEVLSNKGALDQDPQLLR